MHTQINYLKQGDKIAIIATARKISPEELKPSIDLFTSWGLEVVLGENVYAIDNQYAGTDEQRASDLQTMIDREDVKAIVIARGGYGTVRIVDSIDFTKVNNKLIIGYSDITVLHSHLYTNKNVCTIHAEMPIHLAKTDRESARESLRNILVGNGNGYTFAPHKLNKTGNVNGIVIGGNLSLVYALAGTPSDIDTKDKILFIEDLDEYLYHIDRMVLQLKRSGKLAHLKALIVGGMSDMKDNTVPFGKTAEQIIYDAVKEYNYPVCFNFPAGHVIDNRAILLGAEATLVITKDECVFKQLFG